MATHLTSTNVTKTVQEKAHAGTDIAAQATHNLIDQVAQRAEGSEQRLRESALQAQKQLKSSWKTARSKSIDAKNSVNGFVRRHPVVSLGLALGVGALLMARGKRSALPANVDADGDSALH